MPTRRPKHRALLDDALTNFQQASLSISRKLKTAIKYLDAETHDFHDLAKSANLITNTAKTLTELAPFFAAKQSIEGMEGFIRWLSSSTIYIGDERARMIDAAKAYQSDILKDAGFLEREQYQLL